MAAPTVGSTWSPNDSYILKVTGVNSGTNTCYAKIYTKTKTLTSYATIPNYYTNSSNGYRYYIGDVAGCFQNCTKMTAVPSISTNLTRVTNFTSMFSGCTSLTNTANFFSWLHSVYSQMPYNFTSTFYNCSKITTIPDVLPYGITISSMNSCFCGCTKLQKLPIKTSDDPRYDMKCFFGYHNADSEVEEEHRQVTVYNMTSCFQGCTSLKIWPVPLPQGITNLTHCFYGCTSMEFYNSYDDKFNIPSIVTDMSYTFWKCKSIEYVGYINAIPPSNETWALQTLEGCFYGCENLTYGLCLRSNNSEAPYLSNIVSMYENCTSATLEDIGSLSAITHSAVDATCLFAGSDIFNSIDFNSFRQDFPNIYSAGSMFSGCESLSLIENFDKFEIKKGGNIFNGCSFLDMAGQTIKLPESLIDISHLFQGIGVGFNIEVEPGWTQRSTITPIPENVFPQISENFYLLYNSDSTTETFLQELANSYNNVHYSGDDLLAPTISFNLLRVNSTNSEIEDRNGSYVYINTTVNYPQKNIPYGYSYEYFDDDIKIDNTYMTISSGWSNYNHTSNKDWGQLNDKLSHTISVSYIAVLKDGNEQEVPNTYKSSGEISQTLTSAFALLDFYPGGKGMAIGHYADKNGLDITYPTMIGQGLSTPLLQSGEIDIAKNQLVIGKYNIIDNDAVFIIGNGTDSVPKNIMTVKNDGNLELGNGAGQIKFSEYFDSLSNTIKRIDICSATNASDERKQIIISTKNNTNSSKERYSSLDLIHNYTDTDGEEYAASALGTYLYYDDSTGSTQTITTHSTGFNATSGASSIDQASMSATWTDYHSNNDVTDNYTAKIGVNAGPGTGGLIDMSADNIKLTNTGNLTLAGHSSPIGSIYEHTASDVSLTSTAAQTQSTGKTILSCTGSHIIPAGCWVGFIYVNFSAGASTVVGFNMATSNTSTAWSTQMHASEQNYGTRIRQPVTIVIANDTAYYIRAWSKEGCTVNTVTVRLMRIR